MSALDQRRNKGIKGRTGVSLAAHWPVLNASRLSPATLTRNLSSPRALQTPETSTVSRVYMAMFTRASINEKGNYGTVLPNLQNFLSYKNCKNPFIAISKLLYYLYNVDNCKFKKIYLFRKLDMQRQKDVQRNRHRRYLDNRTENYIKHHIIF